MNLTLRAPGQRTRPVRTRVQHFLLVTDLEMSQAQVSQLVGKLYGSRVRLHVAESGLAALELMRSQRIDLVVVDYRLSDMSGSDLIRSIADLSDDVAAVLLVNEGSEAQAAEAIKDGARDYLVRQTLTSDSLSSVLENALSANRIEIRNQQHVERLRDEHNEMDHLVRAISHDMTANFMFLEHSFNKLKTSYDKAPMQQLTENFAQVEAGLRESRRFLDDLTRLSQTGAISMEPARVDVRQVMDEVLFEQRELLDARAIRVEVSDQLPAVWCNPARVKQVLTNLIRNAGKYGCDPQDPLIRVSCQSPAPISPLAQEWLRVEDNGPGIPADARATIFLPGKRLAADSEGSGMGLAIVKRIIQYYDGQVFIDPDMPRGTAMVFSLPAMDASTD